MSITDGIRQIANFMEIAARTAPKARGWDNLVIKILEKKDLNEFADKMIKIGNKTQRPQTFKRDAQSVRKSECSVLIGTIYKTLGLDCGFCGIPTCKQAEEKNITCAYNSGDLGIAVGSAVSTANKFHVDNRIMYTMGYTAVKENILGTDIRKALGIPLSATGKNIFFERK
ncbi:MAG: ferredoxin domain-containing protein [Elusimicrobiota bacterium]